MRDERLRLDDMIAAARAACEYVADLATAEQLRADRKSRDAVLYNLLILGEAAKGVPESVRAQYPDVPWRYIAGLRDIVAHEYFGIDDDIVWDVAKNELPALISQLSTR